MFSISNLEPAGLGVCESICVSFSRVSLPPDNCRLRGLAWRQRMWDACIMAHVLIQSPERDRLCSSLTAVPRGGDKATDAKS